MLFMIVFYTSHYTEISDQAACSFLDQIDIPRLTEQSKETLNQPVTKSELLQNLKSMSHNTSAGLDGLPAEFYIVFFHDIADLLIASLNFSLNNVFCPLLKEMVLSHYFLKTGTPILFKVIALFPY